MFPLWFDIRVNNICFKIISRGTSTGKLQDWTDFETIETSLSILHNPDIWELH